MNIEVSRLKKSRGKTLKLEAKQNTEQVPAGERRALTNDLTGLPESEQNSSLMFNSKLQRPYD